MRSGSHAERHCSGGAADAVSTRRDPRAVDPVSLVAALVCGVALGIGLGWLVHGHAAPPATALGGGCRLPRYRPPGRRPSAPPAPAPTPATGPGAAAAGRRARARPGARARRAHSADEGRLQAAVMLDVAPAAPPAAGRRRAVDAGVEHDQGRHGAHPARAAQRRDRSGAEAVLGTRPAPLGQLRPAQAHARARAPARLARTPCTTRSATRWPGRAARSTSPRRSATWTARPTARRRHTRGAWRPPTRAPRCPAGHEPLASYRRRALRPRAAREASTARPLPARSCGSWARRSCAARRSARRQRSAPPRRGARARSSAAPAGGSPTRPAGAAAAKATSWPARWARSSSRAVAGPAFSVMFHPAAQPAIDDPGRAHADRAIERALTSLKDVLRREFGACP